MVLARGKHEDISNDLFEIASALRSEMNQLSVWQQNVMKGEIRRLQERERLLRVMGKYEFSRLPRNFVHMETSSDVKIEA